MDRGCGDAQDLSIAIAVPLQGLPRRLVKGRLDVKDRI